MTLEVLAPKYSTVSQPQTQNSLATCKPNHSTRLSSCQLHVDLRDQLGVFSLKGRPTTSYIYIIEENIPNEKGE